MQFRLMDFSVLCHFDRRTFLSNVISTLWHFAKNHFALWTFRIKCHFEFFSFMSFRALWYFDLLTFRSYIISTEFFIKTFWHIIKSHFDLRTFRSYVVSWSFRNTEVSVCCLFDIYILFYFNLWTFHHKSFRPSDISFLCHFDLRYVRSK